MNISFEIADKVNGLLTLTVEEADYQENVEKALKDFRKKANYPGFRPGMVPMGLIKKQYGASAKMDAINKLIGEQIYKYVQDNKIQMLGEPLQHEGQEPQDLEKPAPYTFQFDIAVAPEFSIELNGHNKIDHYTITVDDALIDRQVDMFASRLGSFESVDSYEDNDMLKGDLRELDEKGNTKEGGLTVEAASVMPNYIKNEAQKALFNGAKKGDIITMNPREAYENDAELAAFLKVKEEELGNYTGNFSYQITDIQRYKKHAVDQELFDRTFGEGEVKSEKAFRERIAEGLKEQLSVDADYKFIQDVRAYCEKKVGDLQFPDALLKRIMLNNNKERGEEFVEKNYANSLKELTWRLIKDKLVAAHNIKVDDKDVLEAAKETARVQFAQYGMNNVPDDYVENYAKEIMKKRENVDGLVDRASDIKLCEALKKVVKLNEKEISLEDFNKMMSE
ncbi:MAG: trigger factor [Prevotella sp.]|nr:trigger factor [Prevotella sp.]MBF1585810.1 trigger factor [Prevotella sp.]